MRPITYLLILALAVISLAGCGKAETQERVLPDGRTVIVDAAGRIIPEGKVKPLEGYTYDEQTGRYVNETTGIWYVMKDGYRVINVVNLRI